MQVRFANQRTVTLRSKEIKRDVKVIVASQLNITFRASVIKKTNVVHCCKDMRVNVNTGWGGIGYAMVKIDTEILHPVPWLMLRKRC